MIHRNYLLLIILFLSNCESNNENLLPLEGKVNFKLYETYVSHNIISSTGANEPEFPKIALYLETEMNYNCYNWVIATKESTNGSVAVINIFGVAEQDICATSRGPARKLVFLNLPNGNSKLILQNNSQKDLYNILITDSSIHIIKESSSFTVSFFNSIYRYPKNSFAYICGTDTNNTWIYQNFIDTVTQSIALQEIYFTENWNIPYPDSFKGYYVNFPARFFKYQDKSDYDQIGVILSAYKQNILAGQLGTSISLINWENKKFKGY